MARPLEMPLCHVLYDGDRNPREPIHKDSREWGSSGKDARCLRKLCGLLSKMNPTNRELFMDFAQNMTKKNRTKPVKQMAASA
jgi:hypothetical protein